MSRLTRFDRRLDRIERQASQELWRSSSDGATAALQCGEGTTRDLEILYDECGERVRGHLVRHGVDRVLVPNVLGYTTWHWIAWILSFPPGEEVPDQYRRELTSAARTDNPYERMRPQPSKYPPKKRDENVLRWIAGQLCVMSYDRVGEEKLRAEVAGMIPTDPDEIEAVLRLRKLTETSDFLILPWSGHERTDPDTLCTFPIEPDPFPVRTAT